MKPIPICAKLATLWNADSEEHGTVRESVEYYLDFEDGAFVSEQAIEFLHDDLEIVHANLFRIEDVVVVDMPDKMASIIREVKGHRPLTDVQVATYIVDLIRALNRDSRDPYLTQPSDAARDGQI